jgi:hypothetical protein
MQRRKRRSSVAALSCQRIGRSGKALEIVPFRTAAFLLAGSLGLGKRSEKLLLSSVGYLAQNQRAASIARRASPEGRLRILGARHGSRSKQFSSIHKRPL